MKSHISLGITVVVGTIIIAMWVRDPSDRTAGTKSSLLGDPLTKMESTNTAQSGLQSHIERSIPLTTNLSATTGPFSKPSAERLALADKELLIQSYRRQTNLIERYNLTLALALRGGDDVVELFTNVLTNEYSGKTLAAGYGGIDEEGVLFFTVRCLGLLAQYHESAFEFLRVGVNPAFWKEKAQWNSRRGADTYGLLASTSIQALGISGRPETLSILEQLKAQELRNSVDEDRNARQFHGAVASAAFYYDVVSKKGKDYFRQLFGTEKLNREFAQWGSSENGKVWWAWFEQNARAL